MPNPTEKPIGLQSTEDIMNEIKAKRNAERIREGKKPVWKNSEGNIASISDYPDAQWDTLADENFSPESQANDTEETAERLFDSMTKAEQGSLIIGICKDITGENFSEILLKPQEQQTEVRMLIQEEIDRRENTGELSDWLENRRKTSEETPKPDQDTYSPEQKDYDAPEQVNDPETEARKLGAKVLSLANFESRHQPIVDSSFNKARRRGEKLPGKNNERRNYSYLSRIEKLVEKHGNRLEQKLWDASVDKLIISPNDITGDYWHTQEQILRDEGQGRKLTGREKQILTDDIRRTQRESLKSWSDYLGSEASPYPMWFKIYAWDGMSKMGVFDKEKQQFAKRDKHTVAPYPKLNPATLAKVYNAVSDFYDQPNDEHTSSEGSNNPEEKTEQDAELEKLVRSGNFNKLYSKILLSEKVIPKTPENTEDVHGAWLEYSPGEEEKLAEAAEGTPWCVADPGTGRRYLEYGNYNGYRDYYGTDEDNKAKFILFHLQDPETNTLSPSACASIRLDPNGNVAEISGLNDGQALEDSLVPIVEEKVKRLPGGEEFLEALADKKQLIALDRKMQNDEDLTKEELEFLYEANHPIKTLDTYNTKDPRIDDLRCRYPVRYAIKNGVDPQKVYRLAYFDVATDIDTNAMDMDDFKVFLDNGVPIENLIPRADPYFLMDNLEFFLDNVQDPEILIHQMEAKEQSSDLGKYRDEYKYLDEQSFEYGYLAHTAYDWQLARNAKTLLEHGAPLEMIVFELRNNQDDLSDEEQLSTILGIASEGEYLDACSSAARRFSGKYWYLDPEHRVPELLDIGINADLLAAHVDPHTVANHLDDFLSHDVEYEGWLIYKVLYNRRNFDAYIDKYLEHYDIDEVASHMPIEGVFFNIEELTYRGANVDIDELISYINPVYIVDDDDDDRYDYIGDDGKKYAIDYGDENLYALDHNVEELIHCGVSADVLLSKLKECDILHKHIDTIISSGIRFNVIAPYLRPWEIVRKLDAILSEGTPIDEVVSILPPAEIEKNADFLRSRGAKIDIAPTASTPELSSDNALEN